MSEGTDRIKIRLAGSRGGALDTLIQKIDDLESRRLTLGEEAVINRRFAEQRTAQGQLVSRELVQKEMALAEECERLLRIEEESEGS